jgi:hypothetical protein
LIVLCQFCTELEHGSRGIATVRSRYKKTSSKDISEEYPFFESVVRKRPLKTLQRKNIVRSRYQETSGKNIAGWRKLNVCSSDL